VGNGSYSVAISLNSYDTTIPENNYEQFQHGEEQQQQQPLETNNHQQEEEDDNGQ